MKRGSVTQTPGKVGFDTVCIGPLGSTLPMLYTVLPSEGHGAGWVVVKRKMLGYKCYKYSTLT